MYIALWKKRIGTLAAAVTAGVIIAGIIGMRPVSAQAAEAEGRGTGAQDSVTRSTITAPELGKYGMTPIYPQDVIDGVYDITAESSSEFFRIKKAILTVKDGSMSADITIGSHSYLYVFMGVKGDADAAGEDAWISPTEDGDSYIFHIPVEALDKPMDCAAYSKRRKKWYDRRVLFDASSLPAQALAIDLPDYDAIERGIELLIESGGALPGAESSAAGTASGAAGEDSTVAGQEDAEEWEEQISGAEVPCEDGEYSIDVSMTGGSGRAAISSPTLLIVKDGRAFAKLLWSSPHYDYMIVGGRKYYNENKDGGNSYFIVPIPEMDSAFTVTADTTAMGEPVEIEYSLTFYADTIGSKGQIPQVAARKVLIMAILIIAVLGILQQIANHIRRVDN